MAQKGFFVLTDISGYTEFLTKSELDHAQDALQSLFDVQIAHINHPFVISGFRGDAIFMYVPETNICTPQTLLESLENLYIVFADTLRQMTYNTTCTCRACENMSKLDLKMVIHHGEYAIQKLGDREELLGPDVIVPHRMLKNNVVEATGVQCYALFSEAASEALNLSELAYPLVPYSEAYEHLGEVKMQIVDLHKVWEAEQARKSVIIAPEDAWITLEFELPYPPSIVWEYMTVHHLEQKFLEFDLVERTDSIGGRTQTETSYHCAHGETHYYNTILDWKPFDYYTIQQKASVGIELSQTRTFTPIENGTLLTFYISKPPEGATNEVKQALTDIIIDAGQKLLKHLEADTLEGLITLTGSSVTD